MFKYFPKYWVTALCDETKRETTVSVASINFIFAWIFADNRDNRPQNTCVSSNKLRFFFYLKVKLFDIFVILKVMLFFCQKAESVRNTKCPVSTLPAKIIAFACLCLSFW